MQQGTLPPGLPADVMRIIQESKEFSLMLAEFNRADDQAERRHAETMDMLRNVYDEVREQKRAGTA